MSDVLTGPMAIAALLVCVAGVAKLREPEGVRRALIVLGLPARAWEVRTIAAVELGLGVAVLVLGSPVPAVALAVLYAGFAGISGVLRRRQSACGCFGAADAPATAAQSLLSALLGVVAASGAVWPPHRLGWIVTRPVLAIGVAGCVYALVLAYTQLSVAWGAWRAP